MIVQLSCRITLDILVVVLGIVVFSPIPSRWLSLPVVFLGVLVGFLVGLAELIAIITDGVTLFEIRPGEFDLVPIIVKGEARHQFVNAIEPVRIFHTILTITIDPPLIQDKNVNGDEFPPLQGAIVVEILCHSEDEAINIVVGKGFATIAIHNEAGPEVIPLVPAFFVPSEVVEDAVPKGKPLVVVVLD